MNANCDVEEWRPISGFEGGYSVSNFGRVRRDSPGPFTWAGRILKSTLTKQGYHQVVLRANNRSYLKMVHILVAEEFIGPRPPGLNVCHSDGVPTNNRVDNLRYDSQSENIRDVHRYGGRIGRQVLSMDQVKDVILRLDRGETIAAVSRSLGVSKGCIAGIKHKRTWGIIQDSHPLQNQES